MDGNRREGEAGVPDEHYIRSRKKDEADYTRMNGKANLSSTARKTKHKS